MAKIARKAKPLKPEFAGQNFDEFSREDGIAAEVEARAIKKVMVSLLEGAGLTEVDLAAKMRTSRTQVRRLLDPDNTSITLSTLQRAADVTGHRVVIGFEPVRRRVMAPMPVDTLDPVFFEQHVAQAKRAWRKHAQSKTWEEKIAAIERMWERAAALKKARDANGALRVMDDPSLPG